VTFDVDGVRFGCLLGMEVHYPELFADGKYLHHQSRFLYGGSTFEIYHSHL